MMLSLRLRLNDWSTATATDKGLSRAHTPGRGFLCAATLATILLGGGASARAQSPDGEEQGTWEGDGQTYPNYPVEGTTDANGFPANAAAYGAVDVDPTMIPPNVEGTPYAAGGGGYCYVGPHPVDTRAVPGASWDATEGQHIRVYPPVDMRLFAMRDGCYYFTGDPRDFGYGGSTYAYYGAHPVLAAYGGGWCFMMGGHSHLWRPWSPYFTVVGSWNYWRGPYDPFFWSYWPYYSVYYRSYYPHFYGGGRFYRGGGYHVAPPIRTVPVSAWRGHYPGRAGPVMRGSAPGQMYRQNQPAMGQPAFGGNHRGYAPTGPMSGEPRSGSSFAPGPGRGFSPGPHPGFSPGPSSRPSFSPGPGSFGHSNGGGGFNHGGGNFGSHGSFHGGGHGGGGRR